MVSGKGGAGCRAGCAGRFERLRTRYEFAIAALVGALLGLGAAWLTHAQVHEFGPTLASAVVAFSAALERTWTVLRRLGDCDR